MNFIIEGWINKLKYDEMAKHMIIKEMDFLSMIDIIFLSFQYKEIIICDCCSLNYVLIS